MKQLSTVARTAYIDVLVQEYARDEKTYGILVRPNLSVAHLDVSNKHMELRCEDDMGETFIITMLKNRAWFSVRPDGTVLFHDFDALRSLSRAFLATIYRDVCDTLPDHHRDMLRGALIMVSELVNRDEMEQERTTAETKQYYDDVLSILDKPVSQFFDAISEWNYPDAQVLSSHKRFGSWRYEASVPAGDHDNCRAIVSISHTMIRVTFVSANSPNMSVVFDPELNVEWANLSEEAVTIVVPLVLMAISRDLCERGESDVAARLIAPMIEARAYRDTEV